MSTSAGSFMFDKPLSIAVVETESRLLLILGKPGGGKGTISGKILEVCYSKLCSISPMIAKTFFSAHLDLLST
jgi:hypothetical protein